MVEAEYVSICVFVVEICITGRSGFNWFVDECMINVGYF